MKIAYSSNAYSKKSLSYAITSISQIGFSGIEIVLDSPHAFLPLQANYINEIKENLSKNNLDVTNLNANTVLGFYDNTTNCNKFEPSLSNSDTKLRNWRINYTKNAIDLASKLGSPSISITSGIPNDRKDISMNLFSQSIITIATYAEIRNIKIGIEYEPGLLVENSNDVFKIINNDFKNLGLNFDFCHAQVLHEDISEVINKFNSKIIHTHISDCKNNIHYHLIPGLGDIDFKKSITELIRIGYDGYLTAELYPYDENPEDAGKQALNFLQNLIN